MIACDNILCPQKQLINLYTNFYSLVRIIICLGDNAFVMIVFDSKVGVSDCYYVLYREASYYNVGGALDCNYSSIMNLPTEELVS